MVNLQDVLEIDQFILIDVEFRRLRNHFFYFLDVALVNLPVPEEIHVDNILRLYIFLLHRLDNLPEAVEVIGVHPAVSVLVRPPVTVNAVA